MRSTTRISLLVVAAFALAAGAASAQCILANPSFEIDGSGGPVLGGWNNLGAVGKVPVASHGHQAARVSGPNSVDWGVSGFWQSHDATAGEQFAVAGHVLHTAGRPLTGGCTAISYIEWWNSSGEMNDYQSVTVADASSPTGEYLEYSYVSDPAPAGTAAIVYLLAVLQDPTRPSPDVFYDQVTLFSTSAPTIDDLQWNDFPGGRVVRFADRDWRVKGTGYYGPGPNLFSDSPSSVWVDASDRLHLTLRQLGNAWYSTEVVLQDALGYGDYILTTEGRLDQIDPQAVLGIFLWMYGPCWDPGYLWWNAFNEIDIEYSRWGNPAREIAQFVAQPYDWWGNITRFDYTFGEGEITSHAMRWLADRVDYRVWRGGPDDESPQNLIASWTYTGPHIPRPEQPRLHLNLWRLDPNTPAQDQEVVFTGFRFVPDGAVSAVEDGVVDGLPSAPAGRLQPVAPNPFNPATALRYTLAQAGEVTLRVYALDGRLVRTLATGHHDVGEHEARWDGRDEAGRRAPSGVYLFRLQGRDFVETRRAALIK